METNNPVKAVREALKLTQEEMAERMGCGYSTERRCEYTGRLPSSRAVLANFRKLERQAAQAVQAANSSNE
jgi:transcriptional regulator with XRE-family HTH domain